MELHMYGKSIRDDALAMFQMIYDVRDAYDIGELKEAAIRLRSIAYAVEDFGVDCDDLDDLVHRFTDAIKERLHMTVKLEVMQGVPA